MIWNKGYNKILARGGVWCLIWQEKCKVKIED